MKKIKSKIPNKYRVLSLLLLILILIGGNVAYIITYGDKILDFTSDPDYVSSKVSGNKVYVNDLEADYNYYMGLNYTSNNGQLPTEENKNIYTDNNLVSVKITYSSRDNAGNTGYVSLTERQDTYIYFKTYPVNNNNTPNDLTDDYINIELIDNPFTDRPTDLGFNGWASNYQGLTLSFDSTYYERYAKIPVTYTDNTPNKIDVTFNASWVEATQANVNDNFNNAIRNLKTIGMYEIEPIIYDKVSMAGYYYQVTIGRWQSYAGYYNESGVRQNSGYCTNRNGCTYYELIEDEYFDETKTYYELYNGRMRLLDNSTIEVNSYPNPYYNNANMANFYRQVTINRYASVAGYYNNQGEYQTSGTCNTYGGCTYYELIQYYDENGNEETYDTNNKYYYLVTRDTNILVMTGNTEGSWQNNGNYPFTVTSLYNHRKYNTNWTVNSAINCYQDTAIENITMYYDGYLNGTSNPPTNTSTSGTLFGNYNNVKIGRGIASSGTYYNLRSVLGGNNSSTGSSGNPTKYKLVIESGLYNSLSLSTGATTSTWSAPTIYINNKSIYGNDYDRVSNNNNNLEIY